MEISLNNAAGKNSDELLSIIEQQWDTPEIRTEFPVATYRLQLHKFFTLRHALAIVPYLHRLGISTIYLSSIVKARPGSLHGYDVVDHSQVNPELGNEEDLENLANEARQFAMTLILDIVPNHMCIGMENAWWMNVLENGTASPHADHFDIAWYDHPRERLRGKVLLPVLGEPYGQVIQAGRMKIVYDEGKFFLDIDSNRYPIDPRTYNFILQPVLQSFTDSNEVEAASFNELQSIVNSILHLAPRESDDTAEVRRTLSEGEIIKKRLRDLVEADQSLKQKIVDELTILNHCKGDPKSIARLNELIDSQAYRACFWRVAQDEINYRRFFDINDLAALSTEHWTVFRSAHAKCLDWLAKGWIHGLRVDHIDGLLEPQRYLHRLRSSFVIAAFEERFGSKNLNSSLLDDESNVWAVDQILPKDADDPKSPLYVVVEKILGNNESIAADWKCHGTTGYEFINVINGLFVDQDKEEQLTDVYQSFTKETNSFDRIAYESKRKILRTTMASEIHVLAHRLDKLAQMQWWSRDFTLNGLRHALEEVIACFPIYRTYVDEVASSEDRIAVLTSTHRARRRNPLVGKEIFDFISDTLLLRQGRLGGVDEDYRKAQQYFTRKFQQVSSPIMAKGTEDTALYIFNRLTSLNEVGGEPSHYGFAPDDVHEFLKAKNARWKGGLSPLSTHDTKRSEDIRARINSLSELPDSFGSWIIEWDKLNRKHCVDVIGGGVAPDANERYFIYQTLLGVVTPADLSERRDELVARLRIYLEKAIREAKIHSSWIHPDTEYEQSVASFLDSILDRESAPDFIASFEVALQKVDRIGLINSLSQSLVRCIAPGVPDMYQGTEVMNFSLVDPDNRRPVNYQDLEQELDRVDAVAKMKGEERLHKLSDKGTEVDQKLFVNATALRHRITHESLFEIADYTPLHVDGPDAEHIFAFSMSSATSATIVVVPRLVANKLDPRGCWPLIRASIEVPEPWASLQWREEFSAESVTVKSGSIDVGELIAKFPVALLHGGGTD